LVTPILPRVHMIKKYITTKRIRSLHIICIYIYIIHDVCVCVRTEACVCLSIIPQPRDGEMVGSPPGGGLRGWTKKKSRPDAQGGNGKLNKKTVTVIIILSLRANQNANIR